MLGVVSENRLKNFLVAVGDGERDIEAARQRLCSIRDFSLMAAFERIDRNLSGNIDARELNDFLRDNGVVTISDSECDALVRYFDNNGDGKLVFNEFIQLWLPCEDNVLRSITSDRPSIRVGRFDRLPADIELAMVTVIEREINLQRRLESLKRECQLGLDFSSLAALRSIDRYNAGTFNSVQLGAFLRSQNHFATETELMAIIRRIDIDGDAQIGYSEWDTFLRPVAGISTVSLPLPRAPITTTVVEDLVPPYRYWLDYPYYSRYYPYYSRYYPYYSRYYPYYYPYRYYEPLDLPLKTVTRTYTPERPGRTIETTTYHSPLGNKTVTRYL